MIGTNMVFVMVCVYGKLEVFTVQELCQFLSRVPSARIDEQPFNQVRRNPVKHLSTNLTPHPELRHLVNLIGHKHPSLPPTFPV